MDEYNTIQKAIEDAVGEAVEYAEQLSRYILDDMLTQEQESEARAVIVRYATLQALCALAEVVPLAVVPLEQRDQVEHHLSDLLETGWGSEADEDEDEE